MTGPFRLSSLSPAGRRERAIALGLVRRADQARDAQRYGQAAVLYEEAVRLLPGRNDLHVQHGNMLKEAGDLAAAEQAYRRAEAAMPGNADLAMQLGHLFKTGGRLRDAAIAYGRARTLRPEWSEPERELDALRRSGWRGPGLTDMALDVETGPELALAGPVRLSAALAPGPRAAVLHAHSEELALRQLGKRERTAWGVRNVLRGVQAIRGFCISATPILRVELALNGQVVHRGGIKGGYALAHERDDARLRKYVFNVWLDLTDFVEGRYELRCRTTDIDGRVMERHDEVVIVPRVPPSSLPNSDTDVPSADPADPRPLDVQINARPSMTRPARRALLSRPPRTVLVLRPDALGDLVVAVPALRRLRQILPEARIVGVLSPANIDLARTLDLFDDLLVTELAFDSWERRRVVQLEAQRALHAELQRYDFDIAIDLGTSPDSRLLLPLSEAPVLVGFRADDLPGLTVEATGGTKDPWNGHENVPHTNMAMALIEWLGAMMASLPNRLRRDDLDPAVLEAFGLSADQPFAVLHAGGRWDFSRWPYYRELAERMVAATDLRIVLLTRDPTAADGLPPALSDGRFQVVSRRLAFDELDALLSYCAIFVGDDSGVKHLAAMRGAKVIGIQSARNNWSEWGQQDSGYIITRKLPCAGCLIQNFPESQECGRDFVCITRITADEVFDAVRDLLDNGEPAMVDSGEVEA